ncbi:MAG TPA: VOC family protein [Azospirillaceae bacterium]|nr:VOC family protein [Azospirillaceae bacterium]
MTEIVPHLWFDGVAEEAARFYCAVVPGSRVDRVNRSPAETPAGAAGMVLTVEFTLAGRPHVGINGGPMFRFTEALSLMVVCEDQAEADRVRDALCEGGEPGPCGWLKDRYGLSWQVAPRAALALLQDPDTARAGRAMRAMLGMTRLDVDALRAAADAA